MLFITGFFKDTLFFKLFQINIHELDEFNKPSEKYLATSYFKVNKSIFESSLIEADLSLLNANQIVGSLKGKFSLKLDLKILKFF